jgi:hypothetical protein
MSKNGNLRTLPTLFQGSCSGGGILQPIDTFLLIFLSYWSVPDYGEAMEYFNP